ncbi:MOSC domain-containing protein [Skermanella pratensis]|uniref:MOSC domain-containing protein n=1 Tax=Skermanella pratensis TaxID=2233999 RepID=UPI001300ECF7|nr:MOSC domain-containing protein [Skermanella pratensis]
MNTAVAKMYRYPVKGLSAQGLDEVTLTPGEGLPDDRRFAISHGASSFDPTAPEWRPKKDFLMLAKNERLAALETDYDSATGILTVRRNGRQVARGQITSTMGRLLINQFFAAYMKGDAPGTPSLVEAPGVMFSDTPEKYVSILNLASVQDIERVVHAPVDPIRFRANLLLDGLEPWAEAKWVGRSIAIGGVVLEVTEQIGRCAATEVNPATATRDINIPLQLQRGYSHRNCGVYARVVKGGRIASGDPVRLID